MCHISDLYRDDGKSRRRLTDAGSQTSKKVVRHVVTQTAHSLVDSRDATAQSLQEDVSTQTENTTGCMQNAAETVCGNQLELSICPLLENNQVVDLSIVDFAYISSSGKKRKVSDVSQEKELAADEDACMKGSNEDCNNSSMEISAINEQMEVDNKVDTNNNTAEVMVDIIASDQ